MTPASSAACNAVEYLLGTTEVDPIRFDLLFERFINPDRLDLPDTNLDFMSSTRHPLVTYHYICYRTHLGHRSRPWSVGGRIGNRWRIPYVLPSPLNFGRKFVHMLQKKRKRPDLLIVECVPKRRHARQANPMLDLPKRNAFRVVLNTFGRQLRRLLIEAFCYW